MELFSSLVSLILIVIGSIFWLYRQQCRDSQFIAQLESTLDAQPPSTHSQTSLDRSILLDYLVGQPVIGITNTWENLLVGFCTGVESIASNGARLPIVHDYVRDETFITFCTLLPYTEQRFKALCKLDPFERWVLVNTLADEAHGVEKDQSTSILSENALTVLLQNNGFFSKLKEYQHAN